MNSTNKEIRALIEKRRLRYWEIAFALGISPETFSRWLRKELSAERKALITKAIKNFKY